MGRFPDRKLSSGGRRAIVGKRISPWWDAGVGRSRRLSGNGRGGCRFSRTDQVQDGRRLLRRDAARSRGPWLARCRRSTRLGSRRTVPGRSRTGPMRGRFRLTRGKNPPEYAIAQALQVVRYGLVRGRLGYFTVGIVRRLLGDTRGGPTENCDSQDGPKESLVEHNRSLRKKAFTGLHRNPIKRYRTGSICRFSEPCRNCR